MTPVPKASWRPVCPLENLPNETGVAARFGERQVAVFRIEGAVYALDNIDPATGAGVMARGIIGDRGGVLKVSSPLHKESYSMETGACLDGSKRVLETFASRVNEDGWIEVLVPEGSPA